MSCSTANIYSRSVEYRYPELVSFKWNLVSMSSRCVRNCSSAVIARAILHSIICNFAIRLKHSDAVDFSLLQLSQRFKEIGGDMLRICGDKCDKHSTNWQLRADAKWFSSRCGKSFNVKLVAFDSHTNQYRMKPTNVLGVYLRKLESDTHRTSANSGRQRKRASECTPTPSPTHTETHQHKHMYKRTDGSQKQIY